MAAFLRSGEPFHAGQHYRYFRHTLNAKQEFCLNDVAGSEQEGGSPPNSPNLTAADGDHRHDGNSTTCSIGTQTTYRESDTQTHAYTPAYVVAAGGPERPDILSLACLHVDGPEGYSLPAGQAEMGTIQAIYERESSQREYDSVAETSLGERKQLLLQMELRDHAARENRLHQAEADRLAAMEQEFQLRAARQDLKLQLRVEQMQWQLLEQGRLQQEAAALQRVKSARKLARARSVAERHIDKLTGTGSCVGMAPPVVHQPPASSPSVKGHGPRQAGRDIIGEYANPGSSVYAPMRREGGHTDKPAASKEFDVMSREPALLATTRNGATAASSSARALMLAHPGGPMHA